MRKVVVTRSVPSGKRKPFDPFLALLKAHGLPAPVLEYRFAPSRRFRADYAWVRGASALAWPWCGLLVEKNGGIWRKSGHSSGRGLLRDYAKSNLAQELGWAVLTYTPDQLQQQATIDQIRRVLGV